MLGLAQTGTGKTAAFALPILERLRARPGSSGPRALVVAPTRELASQIHAEIELLGRHTPVRAVTIFGGVAAGPQVRALRSRPDVVVACPGRLLDLLGERALTLDQVEVLVLDEADHMFDMGFLPSLRRILKALPRRRQNLLFSATMPREIRALADEVLVRPEVVELGHSAPAKTIEHALYEVGTERKTDLLRRLLEQEGVSSAIVFLRTKARARRLAQQLDKLGHRAVALQGNMSQPQREKALAGFKAGRHEVLVATDIAARGIDVADVSLVVNYDVPNTPDAYTHRIGRTGRSEKSGRALTFVTPDDAEALRAIERRIGARIERLELPKGLVALPAGERAQARGGGHARSQGRRTDRRGNGRAESRRSSGGERRSGERRSDGGRRSGGAGRGGARPPLRALPPARAAEPIRRVEPTEPDVPFGTIAPSPARGGEHASVARTSAARRSGAAEGAPAQRRRRRRSRAAPV